MKKLATLLLLSGLATFATASTASSGLSIINDDYGRAHAEAVKRHVPVFVEVWAPW